MSEAVEAKDRYDIPFADGEYEGRAAFFDLSLDGRWGGVISGDKISIDFSPLRLREQGSIDPGQHHALRGPRGRRQDRLRRYRGCLCERCGMNSVAKSSAAGISNTSTGGYFHQRKRIPTNAAGNDEVAAQRLWVESEKLAARALG